MTGSSVGIQLRKPEGLVSDISGGLTGSDSNLDPYKIKRADTRVVRRLGDAPLGPIRAKGAGWKPALPGATSLLCVMNGKRCRLIERDSVGMGRRINPRSRYQNPERGAPQKRKAKSEKRKAKSGCLGFARDDRFVAFRRKAGASALLGMTGLWRFGEKRVPRLRFGMTRLWVF